MSARSACGVAGDVVGGQARAVGERDLDFQVGGALDDVFVGDDVALRVDEETRAEALDFLLLLARAAVGGLRRRTGRKNWSNGSCTCRRTMRSVAMLTTAGSTLATATTAGSVAGSNSGGRRGRLDLLRAGEA